MADIIRYIGVKALEPTSKPVIIVKGRQVGGTTIALTLAIFFVASGLFGNNGRPPMRLMHCFPQLEMAYAFAKSKLNPMITGSRSAGPGKNGKTKSVIELKLDKTIEANNSLNYKQFEGGNQLWIESTGLTGDRLRGRTVDAIFFDECQNISATAIGNTNKALLQAGYGNKGIQLYFGTPKNSGSTFHKLWQKSSQQYYYLGCENKDCSKKYFPLYTPGSTDWEKIWLYGMIVKCPFCAMEQNKLDAAERGKWVASNPNEDAEFVGFHINQLYMPKFTKEDIMKEHPSVSLINSDRTYFNEVLGEFYSGSAAPITLEEIEQNCAEHSRFMSKGISPDAGKKVYCGIDFGGKNDLEQLSTMEKEDSGRQGGQSYTVAVVLTVEGPDLFSVEFVKRLKDNSPTYKKEVIDELYRTYSLNLCVGDVGFANDLVYDLQKIHGEKFLGSRAMDAIKNHIKFASDIYPKEIQFERNFYIEELFTKMKQGKIKIPYGSYEQISWFVMQLSSMDLKITTDRNGEMKRRFVKGSIPNDSLMALLNAYLAYKFDVTQGFKIINPSNMQLDPKEKRKPLAILGHVSRLK